MGFWIYVIAIAILMLILKILTFPIRIMFKILVNSMIGGLILWFLAKVGIFMMITWWSLLLVGILGVPGVIIAVILSIFF